MKSGLAGSLVSDDQSGWPAWCSSLAVQTKVAAGWFIHREGDEDSFEAYERPSSVRAPERGSQSGALHAVHTLTKDPRHCETFEHVSKLFSGWNATTKATKEALAGERPGGSALTAVSVLQGWQTGGWRVKTLSLDSVGW